MSFRTSRDEDGNYIFPDGRPSRFLASGHVVWIRWEVEEHGFDPHSNRKHIYITIGIDIEKREESDV